MAILYQGYSCINPSGGYIGLDLGPGGEVPISKIRYVPCHHTPNEMLNGRFQGSNDTSTGGYEDIHVISQMPKPNWNTILIDNPKSYRYVRYFGPPGSNCRIGRLEFYTTIADTASGRPQTVKLSGNPFSAPLEPAWSADAPENFLRNFFQAQNLPAFTFRDFAQTNLYPYNFILTGDPHTFYHSHDFIEIFYIKSGSCLHVSERKISYLFSGDIIIIPPGASHFYISNSNSFLTYDICIYPDLIPADLFNFIRKLDDFKHCLAADAAFNIQGRPSERFHLNIKQQKEFVPLLEKLLDTWRTEPPGFELQCYSLALQLFVCINRALIDFSKNDIAAITVDKEEYHAQQIISYINRHSSNIKNLDEIVQALKVSYDWLAHIFKAETGISIYDYLSQIRIASACEKLLTTDREITAIAYEVGFLSYTSFTRMFKKYIGSSPLEFRHEYQIPG